MRNCIILNKEIKTDKTVYAHCFPNPFTNHVHVDYKVTESGAVNIFVYNMLGMKMIEVVNTNNHPVGNFTSIIDAQSLPSGIYGVNIQINDKKKLIKIIKSE